MNSCNQISKPEFTPEQKIEKCRGNKAKKIPACRHCSGKGIWCCFSGVTIGGEIIQPSKKLILPRKTVLPQNPAGQIKFKKPCNEIDFKADYETAMSGHQGWNGELLNLEQYVERRTTCKNCPDRLTCPVKGCSRWQVLIEKKRECPKRRFKVL